MTHSSIRVSGISEETMPEICDVRGNVVYRRNLDTDADISLASLPQAVYVLRIASTMGDRVYRIIKN